MLKFASIEFNANHRTMFDLSITDEKLIENIRRSDYLSYNELFMRYYGRLCQYVYGILQDKEDAEDIVQELFLNLWENKEKIDVRENASAYIYKTARNLSLNHIRSSTNYRNLLGKQECDNGYYEENPMELKEFRTTLYDCINKLPSRSKEILLLHRVNGLKQKEIAEKLNITVKTIKNQIWISLQKLKMCLESNS